MDKQAQDERWNKLSQEEREGLMEAYKRNPDSCLFSTRYFGSHNLNPEPQIKTWEDVAKLHEDYFYIGGETSDISDALKKKAIATLKIAKLIKLGYGGMVSQEEWEDDNIKKYVVKWCAPDKHPYNDWETRHKYFIAFHTPEQREEFMSHERNRKLVEQYYMM